MTVANVVHRVVSDLLGTAVPDDTPLMSAGLDSLGASELATTLGKTMSIDIEPTALFDHPTLVSLTYLLDRGAGSCIESGHSVEMRLPVIIA